MNRKGVGCSSVRAGQLNPDLRKMTFIRVVKEGSSYLWILTNDLSKFIKARNQSYGVWCKKCECVTKKGQTETHATGLTGGEENLIIRKIKIGNDWFYFRPTDSLYSITWYTGKKIDLHFKRNLDKRVGQEGPFEKTERQRKKNGRRCYCCLVILLLLM